MFKYSIDLCWSEEDGGYVALIPEFSGLSAVGTTAEEALREVRVAGGLFLDDLAEMGEAPPTPYLLSGYSGQVRLRMPRSLHRRLAARARLEGVSLNTLMLTFLAEALGGREAGGPVNLEMEASSAAATVLTSPGVPATVPPPGRRP